MKAHVLQAGATSTACMPLTRRCVHRRGQARGLHGPPHATSPPYSCSLLPPTLAAAERHPSVPQTAACRTLCALAPALAHDASNNSCNNARSWIALVAAGAGTLTLCRGAAPQLQTMANSSSRNRHRSRSAAAQPLPRRSAACASCAHVTAGGSSLAAAAVLQAACKLLTVANHGPHGPHAHATTPQLLPTLPRAPYTLQHAAWRCAILRGPSRSTCCHK